MRVVISISKYIIKMFQVIRSFPIRFLTGERVHHVCRPIRGLLKAYCYVKSVLHLSIYETVTIVCELVRIRYLLSIIKLKFKKLKIINSCA